MRPATKTHESTRSAMVKVHDCCPQRAYVELAVPADAQAVIAASFTTVSRDQGWADSKELSFTWFEVGVLRPGGDKSNLSAIGIHYNRAGDPEFAEATTLWDVRNPQPRSAPWLRSLRPSDILQIIPRAAYPGWVNIVREATIEIEYQPAGETRNIRHQQSTPIPAKYYQPLEYSNQQIRLLVVKPGRQDEVIRASFANISLASPPSQQTDFDALSYCWGVSPDRVDIQFETEDTATMGVIGVPPTIEKALRRLRTEDTHLRIWVDFICINQTDLEERSHQVSIMGIIYSRARTVHIWLDEDTSGLEAALRVIRDLHNYDQRICPGGDGCSCSGTKHTLSSEDLDAIKSQPGARYDYMVGVFSHHMNIACSFDADAIDASGGKGNAHLSHLMQSLFQHPWFQRVWVIQEATLSEYATLVHCGKETISWDELLSVNNSLEMSQPPHIRGQIRMPLVWRTLDNDGNAPKLLPLLEVFLAALDLRASDQRDKLYAMLAFGRETCIAIPPALRPDYTKPLPSTMANFTRWCIEQYRSLDILSFIHCHPARAWQRTLSDQTQTELSATRPTWAIGTDGFSTWSHMTLLRQFPMFQASANTVPDEKLLKQDGGSLILRLHGYKLGSVMALAYPPQSLISLDTGSNASSAHSFSQPAAELRTVFHCMFDPSGCTGLWSHPGTRNKRDLKWDPINQVLTFADHVKAHTRYLPHTNVSQHTLLPASGTPGRYDRFRQDGALPACIDECFFITSDGSSGLCPWTAREGDVVALLHGGKVPYMLRPVPPSQQEHDGLATYRLVGECFVDKVDVMNGELMREKMGNGKPLVFVMV
ncbi:putative heterokaryon incompatibility protein [Staphylotrichum tortipilum]|uniref:Heterokaryon incompatibility protein n=1 Tax=Staphylotrichum tortipilum TaxID=2831512 RepID=A0AAN6RNW8_9PEZI|nr:putative heterokaryon incompatibility protein [Staphylotrichum longicolle]